MIIATVQQIDSLRPSQFPGGAERAPVTFSSPMGPVSDWFDATTISRLSVGATVALVPKQRGKGYFITDAPPSAAPAPFPAAPPIASARGGQPAAAPSRFGELSREEKKALLNRIGFEAKVIHECYKQVSENFGEDNLSEERLCAFATTLFIGLSRKI